MSKCVCGRPITCPCQKRTAKDGSARCSGCVEQYNKTLNAEADVKANVDYIAIKNATMAPQIQKISVKYNNYNN